MILEPLLKKSCYNSNSTLYKNQDRKKMIYLLERTLPLLQVTTELDCEFVDFQRTLYIELSAQHQIDPQGQHLLRRKNYFLSKNISNI